MWGAACGVVQPAAGSNTHSRQGGVQQCQRVQCVMLCLSGSSVHCKGQASSPTKTYGQHVGAPVAEQTFGRLVTADAPCSARSCAANQQPQFLLVVG